MKNRPEPPPALPRLTGDQLRTLVAAEEAGVKPDCFICQEPVLDHTYTLGTGDLDDRVLINSPCGHSMSYNVNVAKQMYAEARASARAAPAWAGGQDDLSAGARLDTPENGAWFTVWLESGKWRWTTSKMTTEQREYAADRVAAYSRFLATEDGDLGREEPSDLRWWRADR